MIKTKSTTFEAFLKPILNVGLFGGSLFGVLFVFIMLFLPLVFSASTNEGYEFPKTIFLYLVGGFTITVFITKRVWNRQQIKLGSIWPMLYILAYGISTLFSSHAYTSVWGYYSRFNGGLLSVLIFFGLYIVAINVFTAVDLQKILRLGVYAVLPISIYAFAQYFGNLPFLWASEGLTRVSSTIGQPNWLAQYLVIILPICLYFALLEQSVILTAIYLLGFITFWLTFSLSGFLGFAVAFVGLIYVLKRNTLLTRDVSVRLVIISLCMAVVIATNAGFVKARLNDVFIDIKNWISEVIMPVVYAQENGSSSRVSDPGIIRFGIWKGVWKLVTSSPKTFFIGTGPETFPYAFQPYRPVELNYSSEWEFVFNKPHNYYLELFSEQGIVGLVLWVVLLVLILKSAPAYLKSCVVGFAITNIFGWPVSTTDFLFWFVLAFSGVCNAKTS